MELRKFPIAADIYTQATDVEKDGMIDYKTDVLQVPEGLLRDKSL